jgi:hypothetical protein
MEEEEEEEEEDLLCTYCLHGTRHPLFLYVFVDGRVDEIRHRRDICIGLSSQPFKHVRRQNRERGFKESRWKATKSVAPHWKIRYLVEMKHSSRKYRSLGKHLKPNPEGSVSFQSMLYDFICSVAKAQQSVVYEPSA